MWKFAAEIADNLNQANSYFSSIKQILDNKIGQFEALRANVDSDDEEGEKEKVELDHRLNLYYRKYEKHMLLRNDVNLIETKLKNILLGKE